MTLLSTTPILDHHTPLDYPELPHTIAHINEEHWAELLGFLDAFTPITSEQLPHLDVKLTNVYTQGLALNVTLHPKTLQSKTSQPQKNATDAQTENHFIPFETPITTFSELQAQYIALKQRADKKRGKKTIKLTQQSFVVERQYKVSENMLRLVLQFAPDTQQNIIDSYQTLMPNYDAGYAYLFDLTTHQSNHKKTETTKKNSQKPNRQQCYYTLRKAWRANNNNYAWVDVFLHGATSGGRWAQALQSGDSVFSKREVPEKIEHLQDGQALLIADETSMPTVARLLELWTNPIPPLVICVTTAAADQYYFDNVDVSSFIKDKVIILPLITGRINAGATLAPQIETVLEDYLRHHSLSVDKVWGALEAKAAKALRPLLEKRLGISRADSVIKVYWRHD